MTPAAVVMTLAILLAAQTGGPGGSGSAPQGNSPPSERGKAQPLRRIEGTVADVDPLGLSFRQLSVDMRQPVGFGGVYQVPASRSPSGRPAFARLSGATVAVFNESTYAASPGGPMATIAPGTVFYIGGIPERPAAPRLLGEGGTLLSTAVDLRAPVVADSAAGTTKVQTTPVSPEPAATESSHEVAAERVASQWPQDPSAKTDAAPNPPTSGILGDEAYRSARVTQLLRTAAERFTAANSPTK